MNNYEEGLKLLQEKFGGGKDNIISLATISYTLHLYFLSTIRTGC
jgi:hypothetical protein